jgi:putative nucleotidyltransferase with HDIG domain
MIDKDAMLVPGYEMVRTVTDSLGGDFPLYLVGGSVRDLLLGKKPKDFDFTTPLTPDEIEARIRAAGRRPYLIGKKYGTVGFKLDGQLIEITTFRTEKYVENSRRPEVVFVDKIIDDLARRDFTFNAIALSKDSLIDPFGGVKDLGDGYIRSVGSPKTCIMEDPLRILRMIRFVATFGYDVDGELLRQAGELARKLKIISHERISGEMDRIITGGYAVKALGLMADLYILRFAVPVLAVQVGYDQNTKYHTLDLWTHSLKTLEAVEPEVDLRWAALLHDVGKPFARVEKPGRSIYVGHDIIGGRLVRMIAYDLKWSKDRTETVANLVAGHLDDSSPLRKADNAAK